MSEPTIRDYVQHKPECAISTAKALSEGPAGFRDDPIPEQACTCGLDRLLAALSAPKCRMCNKTQPCPEHGRTPVTDADFEELHRDVAALSAPPAHRCSGCGHRWEGPLHGAELCGDCWRKAQGAALAAPPDQNYPRCRDCVQLRPLKGDVFVCPVLNGRLHASSLDEFGCIYHERDETKRWPDDEPPLESHDAPYVPSWCYPKGPKMCPCGHHEGYHGDDGRCLHAASCSCSGIPETCVTPLEEIC